MQNDSDKIIEVLTLDDMSTMVHFRFLLHKIGRYYPITQTINEEDKAIILFCQDSTTQAQRLDDLQKMLEDFSLKKRAFEETLPQLEANAVAGRNPSIQDKKITFQPHHIFRKDRCDRVLIEKASTLYVCLNIAYQKQSGNMDNDLIALESMIEQFDGLLASLSDTVSRYAISSSAFSLAKHIEFMGIRYAKIPKRFCFFGLRNIDVALEEIEFLKVVSNNENCNDEVRYAALKVLEQKSCFQPYINSKLRALLNEGLSHTNQHVNQALCFRMIREFCHKNNIIFPDQLQLYVNAVMREQASPMF